MVTGGSYSQFGEDNLIWEYFERKTTGFFVEVGANDPKLLSQSWSLEEQGWQGILIEPQSSCCVRLRQERKRSRVFQVACSAPGNKGKAVFYLSHDEARSTLEQHMNDTKVVYHNTEEVEVVTLDEVLSQAGNPKIDFLSIDVEGTELEVLQGFDLRRHQPGLILVEDDVHSLILHRYLSSHAYRLVKRTGCNNWYVPKHRPFALTSPGERLKLFRKMWLGTPWRALQHKLKKWRAHRSKITCSQPDPEAAPE